MTALVLSFQSCGQLQGQGNGDPHEGLDLGNRQDYIQIIDDTISGQEPDSGGTPSQPPAQLSDVIYMCQIQTNDFIDQLFFTNTDIHIRGHEANEIIYEWDKNKVTHTINRSLSANVFINHLSFNEDNLQAELNYSIDNGSTIIHRVQCYENN